MKNPIKAFGEGPLTGEQLMGEYNAYSTAGSTVIRQSALAGIAIVWLFHVTVKGAVEDRALFPAVLAVPLSLFVLCLLADMAQYAYETRVHMLVMRQLHETNLTDHVRLRADVHRPAECAWSLKVLFLVLGYVALPFAIWCGHLLAFGP